MSVSNMIVMCLFIFANLYPLNGSLGRQDIFKDPSYIQNIKDIQAEVDREIGKKIPDEIKKHKNLYLHFKIADRDSNGVLDGAEVKFMLDRHIKTEDLPKYNISNEEDLVDVIDNFMKVVDKNEDGYVSYSEYIEYLSND